MSLAIFPQEWLDGAAHAWMALCLVCAAGCVLKAAWIWVARLGPPWRHALSACWLVALGCAGPWMFGGVGAGAQLLIDQAWRHSVEIRVEAPWEGTFATAPDPRAPAWSAAARSLPGDADATVLTALTAVSIACAAWAWARRRLSRMGAGVNQDPWACRPAPRTPRGLAPKVSIPQRGP